MSERISDQSFIRVFPHSLSTFMIPVTTSRVYESPKQSGSPSATHSPLKKSQPKYRSATPKKSLSPANQKLPSTPKHNSIRNTDMTGTKLVQKLRDHREKLVKKLHVHTMLFNLEHINKCIKHDCFMSAYDAANNRMLCAACLTENKVSKSKSNLSKSPIKTSTVLPLEKSVPLLQSYLSSTKSQIEDQIMALKTIENILYEGFEEERKELDTKLRVIDEKYEKAVAKLKEAHLLVKEQVLARYRIERDKHQGVIRELGMLRTVIEDYLASRKVEQDLNTKKGMKNQFYLTPQLSYLQRTSPYIQSQAHLLSPTSKTSQNPSPSLKQLVFRHITYTEMTESLKFHKSGFMWSKEKHHNSIKQVSDRAIRDIDKLTKLIDQMSRPQVNR